MNNFLELFRGPTEIKNKALIELDCLTSVFVGQCVEETQLRIVCAKGNEFVFMVNDQRHLNLAN